MAPSLVQLIPYGELSPTEARELRERVIRELLAKAVFELKRPEEKLVVRDIAPGTDLDFSNEDWFEVTGATRNAYETMSTGTMADERYISIYGVRDSGIPSCTLLRISVGDSYKTIWNLQALPITREDERIGFSPMPIIIPPNVVYTIARYVRITNSPTQLVLKGVVVEPRGRVISP